MTTFKGQLVLALVLNIGLKLLTFTLSTLLTRRLLPYQNGVYFTYNVYNDAVLFVAREATRNVASRISILKKVEDTNGDENNTSNGNGAAQKSSIDGRPGASSPAKLRKAVEVANVRRTVGIALCSVPIAVATALVLEVVGLCFGRISLFPSMLRHARVSQQQYEQPPLEGVDAALRGLHGHGSAPLLQRLPMLLFPLLPELTVISCAVLMALVEPCVVLVQSLNLFRVIVVAECATLTARLLTILAVVYSSQRRGAEAVQADGEALNGNGLRTLWEARMALAFGQLAYAVTHVLYYAVVMSGTPVARWLGASAELEQVRVASVREQDAAEPTPLKKLRDAFAFPWCFYTAVDAVAACRQQSTLLFTFLRESLLRLVLSEGESFALTSLGSEAARGYYQLIYSLGSLVARLLFRVWENACFVKWSREASLGHREAAVQLLKLMLRLSFYVGFSFALLGPPLTRTFLLTMYTSRWATPQVTAALQLCFYGMPLMAWNGLLEAFLRAVATPSVLGRLQRWMIGETVVYIAACYVTLLSFGSRDEEGDSVSVLVMLNTVNMLWRCGASVYLLVSSPATVPGATVASPGTATATPAIPIVQLCDFTHLFSLRTVLAFAVLFVVSRMVTATLFSIALVGVAYAAVVLGWDSEMRRLLVAPVVGKVGAVLRRRNSSGDEASVQSAQKKQQ